MNYRRFLQVADRYEKSQFNSWCRNRDWSLGADHLFREWWDLPYTAGFLKTTEAEYARYYNRDAQPERDTNNTKFNCPSCGCDLTVVGHRGEEGR